jgi:hypothetical protein
MTNRRRATMSAAERPALHVMRGFCAALLALAIAPALAAGAGAQTAPAPVLESPPAVAPAPAVQPAPAIEPAPAVEPVPVTQPAPTGPVAEITAWVAAIDASPDWAAGFVDASYDASTKTLHLTDFALRAERGGVSLSIERMSIVDYGLAPGGGFTASAIRAAGGTAELGLMKFAVSNVDLTGIVVPSIPAIVYDPQRPFTSQLKVLAGLARATVTQARIGMLTIIETFEGINSRIAYQNLAVDGFGGGRIKSMRAGPITMQSPAPEGLAGIAVGAAETTDMDLDAFLRIYDPDAYAGGVGDLRWHQAVGRATYRDYVMELPDITITMAAIDFDKMSVRQPKAPFADYVDRRLTRIGSKTATRDPRDDAGLAAMISAFGMGRFSIDRFAVNAEGIDKLGFSSFHVAGLSSDAVAEIGLDGFEASIAGQGTLKLGHFALGKASLPGADALVTAARVAETGGDVDVSSLIPEFARIELGDVLVDAPELPRIALGRLNLDLANYVAKVPTSVTADIGGLDMPTSLLPNRMMAGLLGTFGYERVEADAGVKLAWNEPARTVTLDDVRFDMKNMGVLTGSAAFSGLSREALERSGSVIDALPGTTLTGGTFTFKDESLIANGLAYRAKAAGADPDKLRTQLATAVPFMLGFLGNPPFQKQVGPVLKAFLLAPGTITATIAPPAPVAIPDISRTIVNAPQDLPNLLGISIKGEPAAAPSAPAPQKPANSPAPATTPDPAPKIEP